MMLIANLKSTAVMIIAKNVYIFPLKSADAYVSSIVCRKG